MSGSVALARALIERTAGHPVISLYLDLDPERFATAPARASQVRSLLDDARRLAEPLSLDHAARQSLDRDLDRVQASLEPEQLPASGARGLAVFCSSGDDLFETIVLGAATSSAVYVQPAPHIEPLVTSPALGRWCAALVSSDRAEILEGDGRTVRARKRSEDYVRGGRQTGEGQTHGREQDIEGHLLQVAEALRRHWESDHFGLLSLAGPVEPVSRLESLLDGDLTRVLAGRLSLDPSAASDADVVTAVHELAVRRDAATREAMLAELRSRLAGGERVAAGVEDVQRALVERRVQTLLVSRDYHDADNRREADIQTAVLQDATVVAFDEPVDALPPARPVAALLRF